MNLETELVEYLTKKINSVKLDELFDNVRLNGMIYKGQLVELVEALYYKELIEHKEPNGRLGFYLDLLNNHSIVISELQYLYIIYLCERTIKKSQHNLYI